MRHMEATARSQQPESHIQRRVSRGLIVLVIRQAIAYSALFFGNILLARWVTPAIYGIFAATLAFQTALVVLSDAGLGVALLQREAEPTLDELASIFTIQCLLLGSVAIAAWLSAPLIARFTQLGPYGVGILRPLAVVLASTVLRRIPALLLERQLRFGPIALAETISTVVYSIISLALVWLGFGLASLIWALSARLVCDLAIIWWAYPWRPRFSRKLALAWPYLRFGIAMQGVRVLAYCKDSLPLLPLVPLLGAASTGQWNWAVTYIGIPVYFNRVIDRLMFPAFARVQNDRTALAGLVETALWLNLVCGLPLLAMLLLFARNIVPLLYGEVWLSAVPIATLLSLNMDGGLIVSVFFTLLYATGRADDAARLFGLSVVLTFIASSVAIPRGGLTGIDA